MAETTDLSVAGNATADEILNDGATGLQYFKEYLERYATCYSSLKIGRAEIASLNVSSLYAKYDWERQMDIAALERMAATLAKVLTSAKEELTKQETQRNALPSVWQGTAADAALTMLNSQVVRATEDQVDVSGISTKLASTAEGLRAAVKAKAQAVKKYWHPTQPDIPDSNGLGRKSIDAFIMHAIMNEYAEPGLSAKRWLETKFQPAVENTISNFETLCTETETTVNGLYDQLSSELAKLDTAAYPMPADTTSPSTPPSTVQAPSPTGTNPGPGPSTTPSPSITPTPSVTPTSSITPSTTPTPSSTVPASTNIALSGLASTLATALTTAVSSLATAATTGLTALGTAISEAIEDFTDDEKDDDDKDDDGKDDGEKKDGEKTKSTEFDLAGKHYKLEVGADGQPKLVETDSEGKTRELSVKLDSNGNPIISSEEKKEESKPAAGTPAAGTPTSGNPTATVPPAGTKKGGEDGEHTPKTAPVTGEQQQQAPVQTGAELSEAGPL
ncbi:WXG100 family type VII secretion target [Nocardia sp. XZ_19_385]|uniref:WXG100 family type VII secretion target n=1 Tax=Nocardia sp. XZ_19_385 TaxID=2769488 RepID=UPI00188F486F|nr:WXG100 family type VII secretion target [Nocardia sp. XZ_19_385]